MAAAGLITCLGLTTAAAQNTARDVLIKPGDGDAVCNGDFGTNVKFVKSPSDAARQARNEEKLVFVLHVSGQFEEPDFT
jgi:hypothetical protein